MVYIMLSRKQKLNKRHNWIRLSPPLKQSVEFREFCYEHFNDNDWVSSRMVYYFRNPNDAVMIKLAFDVRESKQVMYNV